MGKRLHVDSYYLVQVKSVKDDIEYDSPEAVQWLLSHNYPFFLVHVDKRKSRVAMYQTLQLAQCRWIEGVQSIALSFSDGDGKFGQPAASPRVKLNLGPAVLDFKAPKIAEKQFRANAAEVIRAWVSYDQGNIDMRNAGLALAHVPESYSPNVVPDSKPRFVGNFLDNVQGPLRAQYFDTLFRMLAQYVHMAASTGDKDRFGRLADAIGALLSGESLEDSAGIRLLEFAVNSGAKHVGHQGHLKIGRSAGSSPKP